MPNQAIEGLYKEYVALRPTKLDEAQFGSFLAFFPSLLVAASDGIVDREEWFYCQKLAKGLGNSFSDDREQCKHLSEIYLDEFRYLLKNQEKWEPKFLSALKAFLQDHPYAREFVSETVYLFADASHGVSQEEMDKINHVEMALGLR